MKIFIIEDNDVLRTELSKLFSSYGYECSWSDDFENIIAAVKKAAPELILLDINLPYYDGYHICRELRKSSSIPIIIVTSRNSDLDELMAMNLGADDFVTKPYNKQILLARISAVLKRSYGAAASSQVLEHNGITLSLSKGCISMENKSEELTKNEIKILSVLMKNAGNIVSRDELMNELWQSGKFIDDNTLTVNINRLRHKLEAIGADNYISTKRGQGYII